MKHQDLEKGRPFSFDLYVTTFFLKDAARKLYTILLGTFLISILTSFIVFRLLYSPPSSSESDIKTYLYEQDGRHSEVTRILEYNTTKSISLRKFYHDHLSFNVPLIYRGYMSDWPAVELWKDDEYLLSKIGSTMINVEARSGKSNEFAYFQRGYKKEEMMYSEFIEKYADDSLSYKYYWAEEKLPAELVKDIKDVDFSSFMHLEDVNIWQGAVGTVSLPHMDGRDNLLCQIVGYKDVILIPPTQTEKLYVGKDSGWPSNYSPLNFYEPDYEKYPDFQDVNLKLEVRINPGDILFIPTSWWHHIKSSKGKNIAINYWFTTNYMVDLFMGYLDNN